MTVRAEQGKKYLTAKDKTRNDHQSRTRQEIIVQRGHDRKERQEMTVRTGQGKK